MKAATSIPAAIALVTLIFLGPVYPCQWDTFDCDYMQDATSLYSLSCDSGLCFRTFRRELNELCALHCATCDDPKSDCGQRFRRDMRELVELLCGGPLCTSGQSQEARVIIKLICRHSGELPCCQHGYWGVTLKLMKLTAPETASTELLGIWRYTKSKNKLITGNVLLNTIAQTRPHKFRTVRMALAAGQLRMAAKKSHTSMLMLASAMGDRKVVRELLDKSENITAQNKAGKTALMFAASEGHIKVVKILLKAGAAPNLKDKNGQTAVSFAIKNRHEQVAQILERAGAQK